MEEDLDISVDFFRCVVVLSVTFLCEDCFLEWFCMSNVGSDYSSRVAGWFEVSVDQTNSLFHEIYLNKSLM